MMISANKHLKKVISLLIKVSICIFSILYILQKVTYSNITSNILNIIPKISSNYLIIVFFLMFLNWGIEAFKWKYLIRKIEYISYLTALKSILSGVTISIFTPNRVGEFAGRVFYLKSADKIKATIISLIGSSFQLSITILGGIAAAIVYYHQHKNELWILNMMTVTNLLSLSVVIIFILISITFIYIERKFSSPSLIDVLFSFHFKELAYTFLLSFIRYLIFSFQYYLILRLFGIDAGLFNSFVLIALTFFVTSAIPTFALTEITVRGASSIYFFSTVTHDNFSIVAASMVIWMINLAIPALIGSSFIWNLKFFND